jgi:hypothetical protein
LPWAVATTPVVERASSDAASSRSNSRTIFVSAGCETLSRRAAARRLPSSMAAVKALSADSFIEGGVGRGGGGIE